jgi:hypothetical protein
MAKQQQQQKKRLQLKITKQKRTRFCFYDRPRFDIQNVLFYAVFFVVVVVIWLKIYNFSNEKQTKKHDIETKLVKQKEKTLNSTIETIKTEKLEIENKLSQLANEMVEKVGINEDLKFQLNKNQKELKEVAEKFENLNKLSNGLKQNFQETRTKLKIMESDLIISQKNNEKYELKISELISIKAELCNFFFFVSDVSFYYSKQKKMYCTIS